MVKLLMYRPGATLLREAEGCHAFLPCRRFGQIQPIPDSSRGSPFPHPPFGSKDGWAKARLRHVSMPVRNHKTFSASILGKPLCALQTVYTRVLSSLERMTKSTLKGVYVKIVLELSTNSSASSGSICFLYTTTKPALSSPASDETVIESEGGRRLTRLYQRRRHRREY